MERSTMLLLRLGTSALAGDPDPYPWVFWAPNVTPRSVKILSHGSPRAVSQKPVGQQVPTGIGPSTDLCGYSQVYPWVVLPRFGSRGLAVRVEPKLSRAELLFPLTA